VKHEDLTSDPRNVIRAAGLKGSVISGTTAAASLTRERFERESVWVLAAAGSLSVLDTVLEGTAKLLIERWLAELLVDLTAGNKQVEHFQNEDALDLASTVLAEAGTRDWVDVVEAVAIEHQVVLTGTGAWEVLDFPWYARVVASEVLKVQHAAVVAVGQLLAEVVNSIDWLSVTSSVVVLEVAPAAVLVDSVKVFAGEDVTDGPWLWSVGLDQRSDVPVGEVGHLVLHSLKSGMGVANQKHRCEQLHSSEIVRAKLWTELR